MKSGLHPLAMALLSRLFAVLLSLPLVVCKPFLRATRIRERHARVRAARLALQERSAPSPADAGADMPPVAVMRVMRDELRRELARCEAEGRPHVHLARFERRFSRRGVRAIDEVAVEQLRRALADFESMVRNWSSPALADLRSRMAVRLADRSSAASVWIAVNSVAPSYRQPALSMALRLAQSTASAFRNSQQLSIGEVSLSHFDAAGGSRTV